MEVVLAYCASGGAVAASLSDALVAAAVAERVGLPELQADLEEVAKARTRGHVGRAVVGRKR